ncbi:lasso peptide biosynthesis B2 protein [Nocardioides sp. CGMCC 1.13656]|nr:MULTISPECIES: lasso peptide biosynthesis B2 protein [unclassified Nocardioides]MBA2954241.1 lasso peptide biosynthesis B2 protein [Nocardioides sp. CGMCC 1.13656]
MPRVPRVRLAEVPALLAAAAAAAVVEAGLRVTTLPGLARALGAPLAVGLESYVKPAGDAALPEWAQVRVRAARRVLQHWPFGDTCLRQALVTGWLLRRLRPSLHLGVAKVDGEVRAHAWLLVDGMAVDPRFAVSSYQPLVSARTGPAG